MKTWRGHSSLCTFKREATGAEVPFHHRFRSRQSFGYAKDFCPNFPKLPEKFCVTFAYKFSPTKIIKTFFGVTSKKVFMCFSAKLGRYFFKVKQRWASFLRWFSGMLPRFPANQNFWGCAYTLCTPPPLLFITVS